MGATTSNCRRDSYSTTASDVIIEADSTSKTFHIVTIFNFLLTILLWLIEAQDIGLFSGKVPLSGLLKIQTSLLDLVILAFVRAVCLLILYSIARTKTRYVVWSTTLLNTLYLVIKVIYFKFSSSRLTDIILGIAVFILAWVELLYFETKVLTARRRAENATEQVRLFSDTGNPRIPGYNSVPHYGSVGTASVTSGPSYSTFQTPRGSPTHSIGDDERQPMVEEEPEEELSDEHRQLVLRGQRTMNTVWSWYTSPNESEWLEEKLTPKVTIHAREENGQKTMRAVATLPFSAAQVFRVCFFDNHLMAEWDATVRESRVLERINDHTCIVYNQANEIGGGVISSRDFVSVLHWGRFEDAWVSSGIACTHRSMPPQQSIVRAENGICGYVCKPLSTDPSQCVFTWYLTTDVKGWLPKSVIHRSLAGVQVSFVDGLETRLRNLASLPP